MSCRCHIQLKDKKPKMKKRATRTVFTPEQKASLEAAYSNGTLGSSSSLETVSKEIQLDVSVVKVT